MIGTLVGPQVKGYKPMRKLLAVAAVAALAGLSVPAMAGEKGGYAISGFGGCGGGAHLQSVQAPETDRDKALATVDKWLKELKSQDTAVASTPSTERPEPRSGG